jgi:hypothetical protein
MSTLAAVNLKNPSSATNNVVLATNGDLQFNSGYGSAATAYGCRAWVNFNGTGTVAIRASGNVSSITDNGTGDYTVNFTTAMVDANYCLTFGASPQNGRYLVNHNGAVNNAGTPITNSTTSARIGMLDAGSGLFNVDSTNAYVAIFR